MQRKTLLILGMGGLIAVAYSWLCLPFNSRESVGATPSEGPTTSPSSAVALFEEPSERVVEPSVQARTDVPGQVERAESAAQDGDLVETQGRVIDTSGNGVVGIGVVEEEHPDSTLATTGEDGFFVLAHRGLNCLQAEDHRFTTVLKSCLGRSEAQIIVAPVVTIDGIVVDDMGTAIEGAALWWYYSPELFASQSLVSTDAVKSTIWQRTDIDGRFAFERLPSGAGMFLRVSKPGYELVRMYVPDRTTHALRVVLASSQLTSIAGIVQHLSGLPASNAMVKVGAQYSVRCDSSGQFALSFGAIDETEPLVAIVGGYQAAIILEFGKAVSAGMIPMPLVITLGPPCLEVDGNVTSERGVGLAGWHVRLADGTTMNPLTPQLLAEDQVTLLPVEAQTDLYGGFRLGGLSEGKHYKLEVKELDSGLTIYGGPFIAGSTGVSIVVPGDALRATLNGNTIAVSGEPLANIVITAMIGGIKQGAYCLSRGPSTISTSTGVFEFKNIPRQNLFLEVAGENVMPSLIPIDPTAEHVRLSVARLCKVRVDISKVLPGDKGRLRFKDRNGCDVLVRIAGGFSASEVDVINGQSPWISVSEETKAIVLLRGADEICVTQLAVLQPGAALEIVME